MKAPEKIYLTKHPFDDMPYSLCFSIGDSEDIEYTQTDILIAKACEFLSRRVFNCGEGNLIEDFKHYMKEG